MDELGKSWYISDMLEAVPDRIPAWNLYGERAPFPDIMHMERIRDRAAGLDWRITSHRHAQLVQLFLLECGKVAFSVDGQIWQLDLPCLLFLPLGVAHGFTFAAGTDGWVLTLPVGSHPELFASKGELSAPGGRMFKAAATSEMAHAFERLAVEWSDNRPLRHTRLRGMLAQLLCDIFEKGAAGSDAGGLDQRLKQFMDLIAKHHTEHWAVSRYASELGMSPRNLSRLCQSEAGQSAHYLLEAHLMREACRLLAYTRLSAQAVAYQLGYQDPSYFNRRFRKAIGLPPGGYRRKLEE